MGGKYTGPIPVYKGRGKTGMRRPKDNAVRVPANAKLNWPGGWVLPEDGTVTQASCCGAGWGRCCASGPLTTINL